MSGMFGGGQSSEQREDQLAGIQIQTSCYGKAVPLVFGTDRIAGNLVYYSNFKAIEHRNSQSTGKGGGGSTMTQVSYTYTATVQLAICAGPGAVNRVWRDKEISSLSGLGFTLQTGTRPQTAWAYLTTADASRAVGYSGTMVVSHAAADLGSSGALKNHSFEVTGFCAVGGGNLDAMAPDVLTFYLTDPVEGLAWSASRIGDLSAWRTYCQAAGLWISPSWQEQGEAKGQLEEVFKATNSEPVWSEGKLKVIPYGDTVVSGNGATYTPNVTPLYDLDMDDFLADGEEDPIQVERTSPAEAWNCVPVKFRDRSQDYNDSVVEAPDPVDSQVWGVRKSDEVNLPCIKRADVAQVISRILAQRAVYCRNRYRFHLPIKYCLLEPMDLVTLTAPYLGLNLKPVRILEVEESEAGDLEVLAEEWPFGVASASRYVTQSGDGSAPNVAADPGSAASPVILAAPPMLWAGDTPELWLVTSGGSLWGGCEVWVSEDGQSYTFAGSVVGRGKHGTLAAGLPAGASLDDLTSTLSVQLAQTSQQLVGTTAQGAKDMASTRCWVGGEILSYQVATLTGPGAYNLTKLRRGAYGTDRGAKASGVQFALLDSAAFRYRLSAARFGQQLWLKLRSFNLWGGGLQDLASLTAYTYTPAAVPGLPTPSVVALSISATKPS